MLMKLGPEFSDTYVAITDDTVRDIPPQAGLVVPSMENVCIRPIRFVRRAGNVFLEGLTQTSETTLLSVNRFGFWHTRGTDDPEIALHYYKAGRDEEELRYVALSPDEVHFGFGVHPDHAGEAETWYVRGIQTAWGRRRGNHLLEPTTLAPSGIKNFSLARVIGVIGNPATDEAYRQRMGIPEVPSWPVR